MTATARAARNFKVYTKATRAATADRFEWYRAWAKARRDHARLGLPWVYDLAGW